MSVSLNLKLEEYYQLMLGLKMLEESFLKEGKETPLWLKQVIDKITNQMGGKKVMERRIG